MSFTRGKKVCVIHSSPPLQTEALWRFRLTQKFFPQAAFRKRCADHESIKNERIGRWLIRDTKRSRAVQTP
jgi:hypothetical protein